MFCRCLPLSLRFQLFRVKHSQLMYEFSVSIQSGRYHLLRVARKPLVLMSCSRLWRCRTISLGATRMVWTIVLKVATSTFHSTVDLAGHMVLCPPSRTTSVQGEMLPRFVSGASWAAWPQHHRGQLLRWKTNRAEHRRMLRVLAGGAFSLSLGLIREVCPLDLSRRLAMETTTRNSIILTNKGLAFMTHADNQSGVLSKSSRGAPPSWLQQITSHRHWPISLVLFQCPYWPRAVMPPRRWLPPKQEVGRGRRDSLWCWWFAACCSHAVRRVQPLLGQWGGKGSQGVRQVRVTPLCVPSRPVEFPSTRSCLVDCTCVAQWSWIDIEPGAQFDEAYPVAKRLNTLLRHGHLPREEDGAIEFWRLKDVLRNKFEHSQHWSDDLWKSKMAGGGGFNIVLTRQDKKFFIFEPFKVIQDAISLILHFIQDWYQKDKFWAKDRRYSSRL